MSTLMTLLRMGPALVGTVMGERNVLSQRPEGLTHGRPHAGTGGGQAGRLAGGCLGLVGVRLVGTGMGERNVLWGRPERLTHGRPHAGPDGCTGSRASSRTSSRDGSSAPYREHTASAARPRSAVTPGGLA